MAPFFSNTTCAVFAKLRGMRLHASFGFWVCNAIRAGLFSSALSTAGLLSWRIAQCGFSDPWPRLWRWSPQRPDTAPFFLIAACGVFTKLRSMCLHAFFYVWVLNAIRALRFRSALPTGGFLSFKSLICGGAMVCPPGIIYRGGQVSGPTQRPSSRSRHAPSLPSCAARACTHLSTGSATPSHSALPFGLAHRRFLLIGVLNGSVRCSAPWPRLSGRSPQRPTQRHFS